MRKFIFLAFILTLASFLTACSDKELNKSEVMEKIKENTDDVEKYHTVWDVEIGLEYQNGQTEQSKLNMDINADESSNTMWQTIKESDDNHETTREHYLMDGNVYENENDSGWKNESMNRTDIKDDLTLAYNKIVTLIEDIEDELEMETDNDHYILTFEGSSKKVFDAQDEPYSLEVTGFDEDNIHQDMKIKIDKDNLYIESVENMVTAEKQQNKLEIEFVQDFSDINDIDDIELPEDIEKTN